MNEVMQKLNEHDKKFDQLDKQFDLLAQTVVSHTERLDRIEENMATKQDISKIMDTLDTIVGFVKKTDQELTLLVHAQKETDDRLDVVEKDIRQMKPALGLG